MALTFRQKRALEALRQQATLCRHELPPQVGRGTMNELMNMGLVQPANPDIGAYSKFYAWQLVK